MDTPKGDKIINIYFAINNKKYFALNIDNKTPLNETIKEFVKNKFI